MKAYTVSITDIVEDEIRDAFFYIHERSRDHAVNWLRGLYQAIDTLETMPNRCPLIRENDAFQVEVRSLLYYSHRIIFTVDEIGWVVLVHAFRHTSKNSIEPEIFE